MTLMFLFHFFSKYYDQTIFFFSNNRYPVNLHPSHQLNFLLFARFSQSECFGLTNQLCQKFTVVSVVAKNTILDDIQFSSNEDPFSIRNQEIIFNLTIDRSNSCLLPTCSVFSIEGFFCFKLFGSWCKLDS
uniref:Uncharacterized protein n=1 Tax=Cacopsylla melanoneura TaxID=428564 RepID=A0A8D9A6D4_9HEMI